MNQITIAPVSINVHGTTKAERQISVVVNATPQALQSCLGLKGKVGNAIRGAAVRASLVDIVQHCASGSYRSLGEKLAITLGEPIFISNRATFEALPDFFQARIAKAKLGKNEGMRLDKKTGVMVPGAKLATEMELKSMVVELIAQVREIHATRKASQSEAIEA